MLLSALLRFAIVQFSANLVEGAGRPGEPCPLTRQQHFQKPLPDAKPIVTGCDVTNPLACNQQLLEICNFRNGTYRCECPPNHSRTSDGRCLIVNECFEPSLNDCSEDATCTDTLESFLCACKSGFLDLSPNIQAKPGRICKKLVDECKKPQKHNVDCDSNARCEDTPDAFLCVCSSGYFDVSERFNLKSGRRCEKETDPCASGQNDCSKNATCTSSKGTYTCQCRASFSDVSPSKHYPGRDCRLVVPDTPSTCSGEEVGKVQKSCPDGENCSAKTAKPPKGDPSGGFVCTCPPGSQRSPEGTSCIAKDFCQSANDCHANANCVSQPNSFDCSCQAGYIDTSPDPNKRGRLCIKPEDKCSNKGKNQCSPFAKCFPELQDYRCQCESGYLDVSSEYGKPPGRVCVHEKEECRDRRLNSCDEFSDCVKKPGGYACLCQPGYYDVSSQANLPPGRVCTLVTYCPTQPTDLIFLVDGSGSIGSTVFRQDVLRFVTDFSALFSISPDQTRVGLIQFSDLRRKEFDLNQFKDQSSLQNAIRNVQYLMGMTSTGEAINYMMKEGFSESHGARPRDPTNRVERIAIVITDGWSQDNVVGPANRAREAGVKLFAVGVTDAVAESQLIEIAGNRSNVFIVGAFKDLNTRLRARIQKELCPPGPPTEPKCPDCDPSRNFVCQDNKCICPPGFCLDPVHKICGSQLCNPDLKFTCPFPTVCKQTPFKNYRCACPNDFSCDSTDGGCGTRNVTCSNGEKYNPSLNKCEGCNPPCDATKNMVCQKSSQNDLFCGCKNKYTLDPITNVCTINECAVGLHTCSQFANCTDTLQGFFCTCWEGHRDNNPSQPGTSCTKIENACQNNKHNCSTNAKCIPGSSGEYTCICNEGFVDMYPPQQGRQCEKRTNECEKPSLNNCSKNAVCHDLDIGYRCVCKAGFQDIKPLEEPGRFCFQDPCQDAEKNDCWLKRCRIVDIQTGQFSCEPCPAGYTDADSTRPGRNCQTKVPPCNDLSKNDCDPSAFCVASGSNQDQYTCKCRDGYIDASPDPLTKPGRKCEIIKNPCYDATKNDCDLNAFCVDLKNNKYNCSCKGGYKDRSADPAKPGRVCTVLIDECLVPHLNNCSGNARCNDVEVGYECICKEGYIDKGTGLKGRVCDPVIDPCSSSSLNECDSHAKCSRSGSDYTCECLPPYRDSGNTSKTGRLCIYDGCSSRIINTCGINAICINGDGFIICRCKPDFFDEDPYRPGTSCTKDQKCGDKSCDRSLGLQCDKTAQKCVCRTGQAQKDEKSKCVDVVPIDLYIWISRRNENYFKFNPSHADLANPNTQEFIQTFNTGVRRTYDVTPFAYSFIDSRVREIQNPILRNPTWDKGLWVEFTALFDKSQAPDDFSAWRNLVDTCKRNFNYSLGGTELFINEYQLPFACYKSQCHVLADCINDRCVCGPTAEDLSPENPGHNCRVKPTSPPTTTLPPCGGSTCKSFAGEVCKSNRCVCQDGKARRDPNDPCTPYDRLIYIPIIVTTDGGKPLTFNPNQNNENSQEYRELLPPYIKQIDKTLSTTTIYTNIITTGVKESNRPNVFFPDFEKGILINTTFAVIPYTNERDLCEQLKKAIRANNNLIGSSQMRVDENFDFCDPSRFVTGTPKATTPTPPPLCDGKTCPTGFFCVENRCRPCPKGQWMKDRVCIDVVSYQIPLWIIRHNLIQLNYNSSYGDRDSQIYKQTVDYITIGIPNCYDKTKLSDRIVGVEVTEISPPQSGKTGIITECVVYCPKQNAPDYSEAFNILIKSIVDNFNYSVGGTPLYINNVPPCLFVPAKVQCGRCPGDSVDQYPMIPGTVCKTDPCADSKCGINAKCVPLPGGSYRCECRENYKDNATREEDKGKVCTYDFCIDMPHCLKSNATCVNLPERGYCKCNSDFVDLTTLQPDRLKRISCHGEALCLKDIDVDYCCLQINNCHPTSICLRAPTGGYQCRCRDGGIVADSVPCAGPKPPTAPQLEEACPYCGNNGKCLYAHDGATPSCQCATWYTGARCDKDVRIILAIIFAILFLLLTLCCLLYFCTKCRCWKTRAVYQEMGSSASEGMSAMGAGKESDFYQDFSIPRAKLAEGAAMGAAAATMRDQRHMEQYLDEHSGAVERVPAISEAVEDAAMRRAAGGYYGSGSDLSSEASFNEQYEKRVTTDYKKSQTTKTTGAVNTTAEFHVFPPAKNDQQLNNEDSGEYSRIAGGSKRTASTKYEEFESDAVSEDATSVGTGTSEETVPQANTYDRKILVKRSHDAHPNPGHPSETYRTEVNTVTKSKESKFL